MKNEMNDRSSKDVSGISIYGTESGTRRQQYQELHQEMDNMNLKGSIKRQRDHVETISEKNFSSELVNMTFKNSPMPSSESEIIQWDEIREFPYQFEIHYLPSMYANDVLRNAEKLISDGLISMLEMKYTMRHNIAVISVNTTRMTSQSMLDFYCQDVKEENNCMAVESVLVIGYNKPIPSGEVETMVLAYTSEISDSLDFFGMIPSGTKFESFPFGLSIEGEGLEQMDFNGVNVFQNETSHFLNVYFTKKNLNVKVTQMTMKRQVMNDLEPSILIRHNHRSQNITNDKELHLSNNLAKNNNTDLSTINIIIYVKAKYQSPPEIDLNASTWEAFMEESSLYVKSLNDVQCFSGQVVNVTAYHHDYQLFLEETIDNRKIGNFDYRYLYGGILVLVLLLASAMICFRKRKRNTIRSSLRNLRELVQDKSRRSLRNVMYLAHISIRRNTGGVVGRLRKSIVSRN